MAKEERTPDVTLKTRKPSKEDGLDVEQEKRIEHLEGNNCALVIAPHGILGNDDNTDIIAEQLHEKFGCYAVINVGYPREELNLNDIRGAETLRGKSKTGLEENDFLGWIDQFTDKILKDNGSAMVFHIHGIDDVNIEEVTDIPGVFDGKSEDLKILIGYGQEKDANEKNRLTATEDLVNALEVELNDERGVKTIKAPTTPTPISQRTYCGSDLNNMNQYFRNKRKIPLTSLQSIQLEIKRSGFRESPEEAMQTAEVIGGAITALIMRSEVWTALSKDGILKTIKVKEIDLADRTFESRVSEYGTDEEAFENLVKDIRQKGILQNVIVRVRPNKDKYQLISGFRRLAALERICKKNVGEESFQEQVVPAKIFKSMPDENAFQASFSENLERKDLTLWEVANFSRITKEHLQKQGWRKGQINEYLAYLLKIDARTVRRYLQVSTIKDEAIRKDLHSGELDISIALIFTREEFGEEDMAALHAFFKKSPTPLREFDRQVHNLLRLKKWSQMSIEQILPIPTAADFLRIDADELKGRAEYLQSTRNKPIPYILRHEIKDLKRPVDAVKSNDHFALFSEGFSKKSRPLEKKMSEVFKTKKVSGDLRIEPGRDIKEKIVKLTVSAPAAEIPKLILLTAEELKEDFASLAEAFQILPPPSKQKVRVEEIKIDKNATIAFTIALTELQSVLRALSKEVAPTPTYEPKAQILVRTLPDNKVQFGCVNQNGLLTEKETGVYREGSVGLRLSDIYTPILSLRPGKNTECLVAGICQPREKKEGVLTIAQKDAMNLNINIPTYSPNDLIKYFEKHLPSDPIVSINASDLKTALNKVLRHINPREVRKPLRGIFFKIDRKNITVAGIDGVRLFEIVKPHSELPIEEMELIVSFHTGKLVKEILQKEAGSVRIGVSIRNIYFQADNLLVIGKLRSEEYPEYGQMFTEVDNSFRISIAKLREMATAMSPISDPEDNRRMTLTSENGLVVFQTGRGAVECPVDNTKGKIDVDVNSEFLADLAKTMDGEEVEVRNRTGINYLTFHPDQTNQRALLTVVKRRSEPEQPEIEPKKAKPSGTREWAVRSVNCCDGCSHDCVYCYGKSMANRRRKGHIPPDKWKEEKVRQKDVDKGYRKREGRIMFPSAHDITPNNFKACYTVLEKLLEAGNEVLVVSKPHFECIKPICDDLTKYKDTILYRFTIGAKDDRILSTWEPNAPSYEERKRCLKYAFDSGYNTSVSVEPMLDSEHIDSLIEDLSPLVNDAIWIGKMNHIKDIISNNGDLKEEIRRIRENQNDVKIKAIFDRHKENPKIKWKESIKKVVGLPLADKPGMDI